MIPKLNILKSSLFRESATLATGYITAQAISLLAYLLLTRIFSPADYALFNIFYSYIEVLVILSTCKYELAIVGADNETESSAVAHFSLKLNAAVSLLLLTIVATLYLTHSLPGSFSRLGALSLLIPPMVFFVGTSRIYTSLYNRVRRYRKIAASNIVNAASGALLKVLLGLAGLFRVGLPLGTVLGQAVANLVFRFRLSSLQLPKTTRGQQLDAARRHKNFPLYIASRDLVGCISANLPFLWLALYFDQAAVGLFALALTFTFNPVNMLSSSFERVFYARTAEKVHNRQPIAHTLRRFLLLLNAIAVPVAIGVWFVAEPLFSFCFSNSWRGCGIYVQMLLPWILLRLSSGSLVFISYIFSVQNIEFYFNLAMLALRVAAIAIGIHMGSFTLAILLYAAAGALVSASLLVWYLICVRRYEKSLKDSL